MVTFRDFFVFVCVSRLHRMHEMQTIDTDDP